MQLPRHLQYATPFAVTAALFIAAACVRAADLTPPARPILHVAPIPAPQSPYVTDEQIGQAITRGAAFLAARFKDNIIKDPNALGGNAGDTLGIDGLAVYAIYQSGLAIDEPKYAADGPFMKGAIEALKTLDNVGHSIYSKGIRATALASINRREDRGALVQDVEFLLDACRGGTYTYIRSNSREGTAKTHGYLAPSDQWDNSNSQYGLLGVWSAAEVGAEIPNDYWQVVEKHWNSTQLSDGQWYYSEGERKGRYSMTCAGIVSLFVCHDYLDSAKFGTDVGREPFTPQLAKGLAWMEAGDNSVPMPKTGYTIYGLERDGLASGFKYFGMHDWYREVATQLVGRQGANGAWVSGYGTEVETAYSLLFLSRGRHPILMNKLRFEHFWANRPRDVANLAVYAGKQLESTFNWQVVNLQHEWYDWTDAPILYIASHVPPKLTDEDYAKIRDFVDSGGMLFTQADGGSAEFNEYVDKVLVRKVFPDYEMQKIPQDSPIFSVYQPMKSKPLFEGVTNGARLLWVHSPVDISQYWQQRASKSHADAFQLGINIFVYAAGKRDFQNRIATNYIPEPPASSTGDVVKVARVKYPLPTWDPEPYAWTRFSHYLQWQTSVKAQTQVVEMEKLGDLAPTDVPLAHLTGTMPFSPSDAQIQSLKKYVDNGGILFIDACGGGGFNDSIKTLLAKAFPNVRAHRLSASSPLLGKTLEGMSDLSQMPLRQYVKSLNEKAEGFETFSSGKGQVIYSPMDITNGLLGSQTWGISGYTTPYCLDFMKNLVLWSAQAAGVTPKGPK